MGMCVQARALAVTSLVSVAVGGAALLAMQQTLQPRDVTEVASLADALAVVRQQRVSYSPAAHVWSSCIRCLCSI